MIIPQVIVLPLALAYLLVRLARAVRTVRTEARADGADGASTVLAVACRGLPADRIGWGQAMRSELASIDGPAARRRFALGAVFAAFRARIAGPLTGRPSLALALAGVAACAGLTVAALIAYPALLGSGKLPLFLTVLAVALAGYAALAVARARDARPGARAARRQGMLTGVLLGAIWFAFDAAWRNLHGRPLILAAVVPVLAGAIAARSAGLRAGLAAVTWAGLVGGLAVFIGNAADAFATAGRSGDATRLAGYAHSGITGSAAYWMGEGLAISLVFLLLIPCVTIILGTLGAVIGDALRPRAGRAR